MSEQTNKAPEIVEITQLEPGERIIQITSVPQVPGHGTKSAGVVLLLTNFSRILSPSPVLGTWIVFPTPLIHPNTTLP